MSAAVPDASRRVGLVSVHTSPLVQPGTGDGGGMNVVVAALARELVARGSSVDVFTRSTGADLPPTVHLDGFAVHHLPAGPPTLSKEDLASHLCAFALAMMGHPASARLDLVHAHYWMSGWVGRLVAPRLGVPLVASFHTLARAKNAHLAPGDVPEPALRAVGEERVAQAADAIIASTGAEAELLHGAYGAPPGSVHVIEPGVDLETFRPGDDGGQVRGSLGGGRIVLFVGRLQALKAPDMAVRALAELPQEIDGEPVRLVIVGGPSGAGAGSDPAELRRLAAELDVEERVAVLAPRTQGELAALYRAADVVLVPSHSESYGLVALEAQACGTPVVAADVAGLRAALGRGAGTLVAERTPRAYARAVHRYLVDRTAARAAGDAGLVRAAGAGWEHAAEATAALYRSLTLARGASAESRGA